MKVVNIKQNRLGSNEVVGVYFPGWFKLYLKIYKYINPKVIWDIKSNILYNIGPRTIQIEISNIINRLK